MIPYSMDYMRRQLRVCIYARVSTVSHLFKEYTNQSVKKYINNLRIKQAERLLLTTDLPIGNVAILCGFTDTNYFSTAFKKSVGLSPVKYRTNDSLKKL